MNPRYSILISIGTTIVLAFVLSIFAVRMTMVSDYTIQQYHNDHARTKHDRISQAETRVNLLFGASDVDTTTITVRITRTSFHTLTHPITRAAHIPVTLPNTSAPHGDHTCTLLSDNGIQFEVTVPVTTQCADLLQH